MAKLHHVQALRALAATLVVADHAITSLSDGGYWPPSVVPVAWALGGLGVHSFFVISGFIMMRTAGDGFGRAASSVNFVRRRLARIVPMYWLATAVAAVSLIRYGKTPSLAALAKSLFFIPYIGSDIPAPRPLLGQGWTLDYEMFFYAFFALALLFPRRVGLPGLLVVFAMLALAGLANQEGALAVFYTSPIILFFAVGVVFGAFPLGSLPIPQPILICMLLFAAAVTVGFGLSTSAIVAVLICIVADEREEGTTERIMEKAGDASYSTYLFHTFAVANLYKFWRHAPDILHNKWLFLFGTALLANLVGFAIHLIAEKPLTSLLKPQRRRVALAGESA